MPNEEKKRKIIEAAEEIISKNGLIRSSIAEIARKAGVADSVIYRHFKGKEDLLFAIPGETMKVIFCQLENHLKGIRDAESKLSKMIWLHLHHNDIYKNYGRVLLLECRSNKNFYESPAYNDFRKYAGILLKILEEGVKQGLFRDNVNMRLVRDIIFGTLDYENLSCLVTHEIRAASEDLDDIMGIILPIIKRQPDFENKETDKPSRIVSAAVKIIAKKGFVEAKIAEIAKLAGVSEGTVYEYFNSKDELLLSLPARLFESHLTDLKETFEIKTPLRKLRRMIRRHFSLYLTDRDFLKVFLLQIQLNSRFYESPAYESFRQYYQVVEDIIVEGKEEGNFRQDVNPRVFRNLFLGTFSHMALRWFIVKEASETDMMREIDQVTDLLALTVLDPEANSPME